jgi:hypothetical protein
MGTKAMRHENHLEVKATDGKTSTITVNEQTEPLLMHPITIRP